MKPKLFSFLLEQINEPNIFVLYNCFLHLHYFYIFVTTCLHLFYKQFITKPAKASLIIVETGAPYALHVKWKITWKRKLEFVLTHSVWNEVKDQCAVFS